MRAEVLRVEQYKILYHNIVHTRTRDFALQLSSSIFRHCTVHLDATPSGFAREGKVMTEGFEKSQRRNGEYSSARG